MALDRGEKDNQKTFSPNRVAFCERTQAREELCFAEGFLQDGRGLHQWQFSHPQAGDHNDGDILIMQPSDQAVGQLAPSEMEVDEGYVRRMLGEQAFGLGRSRGWSGHLRSQGSSRLFTASPTLRESSTNRISKPFRSSDDPAPGE